MSPAPSQVKSRDQPIQRSIATTDGDIEMHDFDASSSDDDDDGGYRSDGIQGHDDLYSAPARRPMQGGLLEFRNGESSAFGSTPNSAGSAAAAAAAAAGGGASGGGGSGGPGGGGGGNGGGGGGVGGGGGGVGSSGGLFNQFSQSSGSGLPMSSFALHNGGTTLLNGGGIAPTVSSTPSVTINPAVLMRSGGIGGDHSAPSPTGMMSMVNMTAALLNQHQQEQEIPKHVRFAVPGIGGDLRQQEGVNGASG